MARFTSNWPASPARILALLGLALVLAILAVACGDDHAGSTAPDARAGRSGPARSFAMGFMAVPHELDPDAYTDVFDFSAQYGDVVMIQRTLPWEEVTDGVHLRPETEATIEREVQLLEERNLDLVYAIDPWEPTNRGQLAPGAPGRSFDAVGVVQAYLTYAELVAERYQPRWLALAVDVDQFAAARPNDLEPFISAYDRAVERVRAVSPETRVFVTFQLEDLQDLIPWKPSHNPQWGLLLRFVSRIDVVAVSSFPSFLFPFAPDVPNAYFDRLEAFDLPLALVPLGYASEPGRAGVTFGTPSGQREFLERVLEEAEATNWELLVWFAPRDFGFKAPQPYDLVARMGLWNADGDPKPAWRLWREAAGRPWRPAPGRPATEATRPDGATPDDRDPDGLAPDSPS